MKLVKRTVVFSEFKRSFCGGLPPSRDSRPPLYCNMQYRYYSGLEAGPTSRVNSFKHKNKKTLHDDATAVQASAAFVALYARSKKLIDGSLQPDVHTAKRALLTSPILNGERSVKSRPSRLLSLRLQRSLFLTSSGRAWCASAVSTAFVAKRDAERRRYPTG